MGISFIKQFHKIRKQVHPNLEAVFTKGGLAPNAWPNPKMSLQVLFVLVLMKLRQKLILLRREGDHRRQIAYIAFV